MKANFKPLGLAAAVAAVSAGYAGVANSQVTPVSSIATNSLGDLAIVPYYTVAESWGTGIHVINTSDRTQVVKLRFRRGSDSLDALDINLILSPEDEWTGFLNDESDDEAGDESTIRLTSQDTTCTAPLPDNGGWTLPPIYRAGATEGYIEVIAMGATTSEATVNLTTGRVSNSVAYNAKHKDGVPRNCGYVEDNFLDGNAAGFEDGPGMKSATQSQGFYDNPENGDKDSGDTFYNDGGNVLKVSWFIRDSATGVEFGDDAYHLENFSDLGASEAWMTHQEAGWFSGNLSGFDFPDLNGGSPAFNGNYVGGAPDPLYNDLRTAFGVNSVINDWSNNPDLNVGTDWVITIPGQYVMLDLPKYVRSDKFDSANTGECPAESFSDTDYRGCDQRDIPVRAAFSIWDREELNLVEESDREVVVSPSIPGSSPTTELRYETNVIHWGSRNVLASAYDINVDTSALDQVAGWARLSVTPKRGEGESFGDQTQAICQWAVPGFDPREGADDPNTWMTCDTSTNGTKPPMIGFVAWERSFPENPDGNYGRAVKHSFESAVAP